MSSDALAVIGLIATFAFGALSVVFYLRSRRRKQLSMRWGIVELQTKHHPEVTIFFRDRQVENLSRVRAALWNAGTEEIRATDLPAGTTPILTLAGATVLSVDVPVTSTAHINFVGEQVGPSAVSVRFDYLNPGDGGVVEVLLERADNKGLISLDAPLIGAQNANVSEYDDSVTARDLVTATTFAGFLTVFAAIRLVNEITNYQAFTPGLVGAALLVIAAVFFGGGAVVLWRRKSTNQIPPFARTSF